MNPMTRRETNLRIFQRKPVPGPFFQPRIESWYAWHKEFDSLPPRYRDRSLIEFLDDFDFSVRYIHYYTGMPDPVERRWSSEVRSRLENVAEDRSVLVIETPLGELRETHRRTIDRTWRTVGFAARDEEDLRRLIWLLERTTFHFNRDKFRQGDEFIGDRGEPSFWVPKSPYQSMAQIWMGYEDFILALAECPDLVEEAMAAVDRSYDSLYEAISACDAVHIVNFGENIHGQLLSPRYVERYLLPFYEKRSGQLHSAGKFTHMHLDGYVRPLLEYLKPMAFDGLEALTPYPQGDVSLEEIRDHLGDKILLDGIPAALFLPHHRREELEECAKRIIEYFHPRLVLGISDELPQGAGEEALERVRWVSDYCRRLWK